MTLLHATNLTHTPHTAISDLHRSAFEELRGEKWVLEHSKEVQEYTRQAIEELEERLNNTIGADITMIIDGYLLNVDHLKEIKENYKFSKLI